LKYQNTTNLVSKDHLEIISLDIGKIRIVGIYRPFKLITGNLESNFIDFLEQLERLHDQNRIMVLGGDFNINLNVRDALLNRLESLTEELSYSQLVKHNTWQRIITVNGRKSIRTSRIDHLYTNQVDCVSCKVGDRWTSDHNTISVKINIKTKLEVTRCKTITRDWRQYSADSASFVMKKKLDRDLLENMDVESLDRVFRESYLATQDELCPLRVVRLARQPDLCSNEIERHKKRRKRKLHEMKKLKRENKLTPDLEEIFLGLIEGLNKDIKRNIKVERKRQISRRLTSGNPKTFWHQIKMLEGKFKCDSLSQDFLVDGRKTDDSEEIANSFLDFFKGKVEDLSQRQGPYSWSRSEEHLVFTEEEV